MVKRLSTRERQEERERQFQAAPSVISSGASCAAGVSMVGAEGVVLGAEFFATDGYCEKTRLGILLIYHR